MSSKFSRRRSFSPRRVSFVRMFPYANELFALALVALGIFLALSFVSFDPHDASWFYFKSDAEPIRNWCGVVGANATGLLFYFFGGAALLFIALSWFGAFYLFSSVRRQSSFRSFLIQEWDRLFALALLLPVISTLSTLYKKDIFSDIDPGGRLGFVLHAFLRSFIDTIGSFLVLHTLAVMCLVLLFRVSFIRVLSCVMLALQFLVDKDRLWIPLFRMTRMTARMIVRPFVVLYHSIGKIWRADDAHRDITVIEFETNDELDEQTKQIHHDDFWDKYNTAETSAADTSAADTSADDIVAARAESRPEVINSIPVTKKKKYALPGHSLFGVDTSARDSKRVMAELKKWAGVLEEKLERFGISGTVVTIKPGPVVTLFEYEPDIDIKLSKILALEDDLALALQATSIRILAPIPGRSVVGFEVANRHRENVAVSSIIRSKMFQSYSGQLPLVLGVDTVGTNVVVDLARMPHLLIAGSTGSGKSVALNTMLISLLCSKKPDDLKLILIDPKRLEFAAYADIAHLLFPIITDTRKAVPILKWVVQHMEERYERMAQKNVRSVSDYNAAVFADEKMPFMVVVIDELADLMMTAGKEVEDQIARIAQMARASGIHLLVATQRPSVDVITGLIKVNFPSRISFRVTSKVDSRTILDTAGADKLLGRGDMLFLNANASHLQRIHGAYVSDKEIAEVVAHIKRERGPSYLSIEEVLTQNDTSLSGADDALYQEVIKFLETVDEISISSLQRYFRIGYNRSARIIDTLEAQGKIMPPTGGKTRKVIR